MSAAPSSLLGDRLDEAGAGGVETLRTYLAARQATSEEKKKKAKLPCLETSPRRGGNNNNKKKRGIASGQGASSSPLFMEMCLVPSFKLWLGKSLL